MLLCFLADSRIQSEDATIIPSNSSIHYCPSITYNYADNTSYFPISVFIGVLTVQKEEDGGGAGGEGEEKKSGKLDGDVKWKQDLDGIKEGGVDRVGQKTEKKENKQVGDFKKGGRMVGDVEWSSEAVELTSSESNVFVRLGGGCSVKVETRFIGHTMHATFTTATRVEGTAKEVRTKINSKNTSLSDVSRSVPNVDKARMRHPVNSTWLSHGLNYHSALLKDIYTHNSSPTNASFGAFTINARMNVNSLYTIISDISGLKSRKELLLISLQDTHVCVQPIIDSSKRLPASLLRVCLRVGGVQVDNRAYHDGTFDFPVIMMPSKKQTLHKQEVNKNCFISNNPTTDSLVMLEFQIHIDKVTNEYEFIKAHLKFEPLIVCLEDILIYRISDYIQSISNLFPTTPPLPLERNLPASVRIIAADLNKPVRLRQLKIDQASLLISTHASLKLFFALDSTPMNFGSFERNDVCLTKQQLTKLLTLHYTISALLRTGEWMFLMEF